MEPFIAVATTQGVNPLYDHEFLIPITYQIMYEVQNNVQQLPSIILSVMDGIPPKDVTTSTDPNIVHSQKYGTIEISIASIIQSSDCIISGKQALIGGTHSHNAKLEYLCALHGVARPLRDGTAPTVPAAIGDVGSAIPGTVTDIGIVVTIHKSDNCQRLGIPN